jgi:hypothetical protein
VAGRAAARRPAGGAGRDRAARRARGRPRAYLVPPRTGPPGHRAPALLHRPRRLQPAVLAELARRPDVELSRLSHHVHQAGEPEAVVRHALAAAREAAGAGAFHEALAHYELVLRWSGQLAAEQRAAVLESVWVLYNLSRFDEAVARAGQVVRLAERIGEPARLGRALTPCRGCATWSTTPPGRSRP